MHVAALQLTNTLCGCGFVWVFQEKPIICFFFLQKKLFLIEFDCSFLKHFILGLDKDISYGKRNIWRNVMKWKTSDDWQCIKNNRSETFGLEIYDFLQSNQWSWFYLKKIIWESSMCHSNTPPPQVEATKIGAVDFHISWANLIQNIFWIEAECIDETDAKHSFFTTHIYIGTFISLK